jgi:signal transduction histidine kinase
MNSCAARVGRRRTPRLKCLSIRQAAHALHVIAAKGAEQSAALQAMCHLLVDACNCDGAWIALVDDGDRLCTLESAGAAACPAVAHGRMGGPVPECFLQVARGTDLVSANRCDQASRCKPAGKCRMAPVFLPSADGIGVAGIVGLAFRHDNLEAGANEAFIAMAAEVVGAVLDRQAMDSRLRHAQTDIETLKTQLFRVQKMETLGQLSGGMAHDVNNQLTIIHGYADMLTRRVESDPSLGRLVEAVQRAADRSAATLKRVVAYSREQAAQLQVIDLNAAVREAQETLSPLLGKLIRWSLTTSPEPVCTRGDRALMDQALVNLVINARDAMPQGGCLSLRTGLETPSDRPPRVLLAVGDTGVGMDEAVRRRIFEPFFTTKPAGRGTGLGLAMVRDFVQQGGGNIDVESRPGQGTTFTLSFPQVEASVQ